MAPGHWGEVTCEHQGRTVARLPYVVRGRPRLQMLTQSSLTQTLGPWVERSGARPTRALAREHELLAELEAALPPAQAFSQQFSPVMLNAQPRDFAEVYEVPREQGGVVGEDNGGDLQVERADADA